MAKIKNVVYERLNHKMTKIQAILPVGYCFCYVLCLGTPIDFSKAKLNVICSLAPSLISSYSFYAHVRLVSPRALSFSYISYNKGHIVLSVSIPDWKHPIYHSAICQTLVEHHLHGSQRVFLRSFLALATKA